MYQKAQIEPFITHEYQADLCIVGGGMAGITAAIAVREGKTPRQIGTDHMNQLQQTLLRDDCYLPGLALKLTALMQSLTVTGSGDTGKLTDGISRPVGEDSDLDRKDQPEEISLAWRRFPMRFHKSLEMDDHPRHPSAGL